MVIRCKMMTKRTRCRLWSIVVGVTLIIVPIISPQVAKAEKITHKSLTIVECDQILLGDIFAHLDPAKQAIVISHAPLPGGQAIYNASYLAQLARVHGLDWEPRSPFDQTVVRRQAQLIPHNILEQAILKKINPYKKDSTGNQSNYRVEFSSSPILYYSDRVSDDLNIRNMQYDPTTNRFQAVVITGKESPITYRLSGRLIQTVRVPVLTRAVEKQAPIQEDGIEWVEMAADRVSHDVVIDKKATEGVVAKYKLRAQQVLRKKDLVLILVKKNAVVKVVDKSKNMMFKAKALEEGGKDAVIRLINLQDQQIIQGVIIDQQTVLVLGSPQP